MSSEQKVNGTGQNYADQGPMKVCPQCGAPMPGEMRFCRSCGQRLGEGPAEYTETVRFPNTASASRGRGTIPFGSGFDAPLMQPRADAFPCPRRRRFRSMTWVWIAMAIFFAGGGGLSALMKGGGRRFPPVVVQERSYFGVDGFQNTNGGVTFGDVEPPGSPADNAGLVGGDIITTFNGVAVKDDGAIMDLLRETPPGRTVDIVYLRDGETKQAQLTTVSRAEYAELERAYRNRPQGLGRLGFYTSNAHRVLVPGSMIYGVRLDNFDSSGPAALAGMQKGDIITAIDDVPIRTVDELAARVHRGIPYSTVEMAVTRGTEQIKVPVKLGK